MVTAWFSPNLIYWAWGVDRKGCIYPGIYQKFGIL